MLPEFSGHCLTGSRRIAPAARVSGRDPSLRHACLCILALFLLAALCPGAAAARDVKVGLPEIPPMIFTDEKGTPSGLFVDLVNDMAAQNGWNIIWVRGTLSESWARLSTGEIDLMPGVVNTPERENLYDFSGRPALSAWSQVYARDGSGISTILDLDGKRVMLLKGDINGIVFRDYAARFNINVTCIEKDTIEEVFADTAAGEADAAVAFSIAGEESANRFRLSGTSVMFNPTAIGFAVPKGKNRDLLIAIDRYLEEGKANPSSTYSRTMQNYFGMKASWVIPSYVWWGLVAIAAIAVLFVIMSAILRRQVRKKTAELSRQNADLNAEIVSRQRAEAALVRKNEELHAAYEQLTATEEELRKNYQDLNRSEQALVQARKKLSLLNRLTIQEIQSGIFTLTGYFELAKGAGCSEKAQEYLGNGGRIVQTVGNAISLAKKYQDLGIKQPQWQKVSYVVLSAISHLDTSRISHTIGLGDLEIYADPLLEDVFLSLFMNALARGQNRAEVDIRYRQDTRSITILVADNGAGIPAGEKEKIFEWEYSGKSGTSLFLAREILSITGISLSETGEPGAGARFEITVPDGVYRVTGTSETGPGVPGNSS